MQRSRWMFAGVVAAVAMMTAGAALAQDWVVEEETLAFLPFENFSIPSEETYNGSIYFFGGYHNDFPVVANDGIRRYDVAGDYFEELPFTLALEMGQNAVTSAHVGDTYYLPPAFCSGDSGGWGSHNRFLEVDLAAQSSAELYPLPNVSRIWGVGSTEAEGKVFFFGGWIGSPRAEISEYDPATDSFQHVANMIRARAPVHAFQATDGWIYYWATGNYWSQGIERFNPVTRAVETVSTSVEPGFEPYVYWYLPDDNAIFLLEGYNGDWDPRRLIRFDLLTWVFSDTGVTTSPWIKNQQSTRDSDDPNTIYVQWREESTSPMRLARLTLLPANQAPVADAGPDQAVEAGIDCTADVLLDGTASYDPDGDSLTFEWTHPIFGSVSGATPTVQLPPGVFTIQLIVDDGRGATDTDEVEVTVVDTTPPVVSSVAASPDILWPPNHKMRRVTLSVDASDACDQAAPVCQLVSVTANEPVDAPGSGTTDPDWEIIGSLEVDLRAERSGSGDGRIYTLELICTDSAANEAAATAQVVVPHDMG